MTPDIATVHKWEDGQYHIDGIGVVPNRAYLRKFFAGSQTKIVAVLVFNHRGRLTEAFVPR